MKNNQKKVQNKNISSFINKTTNLAKDPILIKKYKEELIKNRRIRSTEIQRQQRIKCKLLMEYLTNFHDYITTYHSNEKDVIMFKQHNFMIEAIAYFNDITVPECLQKFNTIENFIY